MEKKRYIMLFLLGAALSAGCRKDETFVGTADADRVVLDFTSTAFPTRSASEGAEAKVSDLDVFIFPSDGGACVYYGHYAASAGNRLTLNRKKSDFVQGSEYRLYLIANCSSETRKQFADFEGKSDLETLKSIVEHTPDIYLTGADDENPDLPSVFLMDGTAYPKGGDAADTDVVLNDGANDTDTELSVTLRRAAAKLQITVEAKGAVRFPAPGTIDPDGEEGPEPPVSIRYNYALVNMRTDARLLAEAGLASVPELTGRTAPSGVNMTRPDDRSVGLTTYTYSHEWTTASLAENETYLVVRIPVYYTADGTQEPVLYADNYYKIPVGGNDGESIGLKRNTRYAVQVRIGYPGASDPSEPMLLDDIRYKVEDWTETEIGIGGPGDLPVYLQLNKKELELHDADSDNSITFASSTDVKIEVTKVWYTNKFGEEVDITDRINTDDGPKITATGEGLNGRIDFYSEKPTNNLLRNIEVTVTNRDRLSETVLIRQYPLDYITFVTGWYSFRSDFGSDPNAQEYTDDPNVTHYEQRGANRYCGATIQNSNNSFSGWKYEQPQWLLLLWNFPGDFVSKVYANGSIDYYGYSNSGNKVTRSTGGFFGSDLDNPRMYHVLITSTSDKYTLGRPKLDANGYTAGDENNAKLVSPSFMLASQLGAVYPFDYLEAAADHCSKYVEAYRKKDGTVGYYDDWRLPTEAEIKIIYDYQYESEAMDEVLSGDRYWSASGLVPKTEGQGSDRAIRCIRDMYDKAVPEQ